MTDSNETVVEQAQPLIIELRDMAARLTELADRLAEVHGLTYQDD